MAIWNPPFFLTLSGFCSRFDVDVENSVQWTGNAVVSNVVRYLYLFVAWFRILGFSLFFLYIVSASFDGSV